MATVCNCEQSLNNTGIGCAPLMGVAAGLVFVPYYDEDGNQNGVPLNTTLNAAYFTGLLNQSNSWLRWYPLMNLKNVENTRAESKTEEFNDGSMLFVQQGIRTFSGIINNVPPFLLRSLEALRCAEIGVYIVDSYYNLIGTITGQDSCDPGYLYPIKVDSGSIDSIFQFVSNATVQKITLKFNFDITESDADLRVIKASEITGYSLKNLRGLIDICPVYSNITQTGFTVQLRQVGYGSSVLNPGVLEGLVAADFTLFNDTDQASVTITSVTETSDGTYDIVMPSQTIGDILYLTPTKQWFDCTAVTAEPIEIPTT